MAGTSTDFRISVDRLTLWLALLLSAAWTLSVLDHRFLSGAGHFAAASGLVGDVAPPAIVTLFVVTLMRRAASKSSGNAAGLDEARQHGSLDRLLAALDANLTTCVARTADLAAALDVDQPSESFAVPDRLAGQIETLDAELHTATQQRLTMIEALLGSVAVRGDEISAQADVAIAAMMRQLAEVDERSRQVTNRIAKRAYALDTAVDGASARAVALVDAVGERVGVQMTALDQRLAVARADLDTLGRHGIEITGQQLDSTLAAAGELSRLLISCKTQGEALQETTDASLIALPARLSEVTMQGEAVFAALTEHAAALAGNLGERLQNLQRDSEMRLMAVGAHIGEVSNVIDELTGPVGRVQRRLDDITAQVATVAETTGALEHRLDERMAATAESFAALDARAEGLIAQTAALRDATHDQAQSIAVASDIFARERAVFATAAAALGDKFDHARTVLDDLDAATARINAGTAEQLGHTFKRVRSMSEVSSTALGSMLERIIGEARLALEQAGTATAEAAFGVPIRREVLAVEAAAGRAGAVAEAAAQRVAGQARAMTAQIEAVDFKVEEIETRLDVRARDTLSARSTRLIEMLNAASVDVARLLAIDASEKAWVRYLKGDRSIFARRIVRLIDRPTTAKIARHFVHDEAFHAEASHYLELFERLSKRLLADPDGDALLATVVSSDIGKLYVAIARATKRWAPMA